MVFGVADDGGHKGVTQRSLIAQEALGFSSSSFPHAVCGKTLPTAAGAAAILGIAAVATAAVPAVRRAVHVTVQDGWPLVLGFWIDVRHGCVAAHLCGAQAKDDFRKRVLHSCSHNHPPQEGAKRRASASNSLLQHRPGTRSNICCQA